VCYRSGRFREERVGDRAVRQHWLVKYFEPAGTLRETLAVARLELGGVRCVEKALPQRQRHGSVLLEISQELPVQRAGVP